MNLENKPELGREYFLLINTDKNGNIPTDFYIGKNSEIFTQSGYQILEHFFAKEYENGITISSCLIKGAIVSGDVVKNEKCVSCNGEENLDPNHKSFNFFKNILYSCKAKYSSPEVRN